MAQDTKYRIEINLITRLLRATPLVHCMCSKFWMKKSQNMLVWISK